METLEQIRPTAVTVVLARRGTGKTYLIGSLIHKWLQQKRYYMPVQTGFVPIIYQNIHLPCSLAALSRIG